MVGPIRFVTAGDGVRIAYATMGSGAPIVVLPGVVSHPPIEWHLSHYRLYRILAQTNRLVTYDPRGQGNSARDPADVSLNAYVEDLRTVLDELGLQRVPLLAQAYSGPVAIAFAAKYPERVSHLLLLNTYASGTSYFELPLIKALMPLANQDWELFSVAVSQARSNWVPLEDLMVRAESFRESLTPEFLLRIFQQRHDFSASDLLASIQTPTVVFYRSNANLIQAASSHFLAATIPGAKLVVFSDREDDAGIRQLCNEVTNTLDAASRRGRSRPSSYGPSLTERELETLALLVQGRRNKDIAAELCVEVVTVERHLANIYSKIGAHSRMEAANFAREWRLVD